MNYIDFEAGNKTYKLRLNTRNTIELERKLGCNPLAALGEGVPTIEKLVLIIHASMQPFNHGISVDDCYNILDAYFDDGNTIKELTEVLVNLFKVSGLFPKDVQEDTAEKN